VSDDHGSPIPDEGQGRERLWREVAEVVAAVDPVPPQVLQSGRDSFAWRTVDAELASLTYDSSSEPAAAVVRGPEAPRQLTFEARELTVGVDVTVLGAHRRLIGQLVPAQRTLVTVRHRQGSVVSVESDELGRFRADVPAGLCSLRCQLGGPEHATPVVSDWILL
jgi:hypothetical protein